MCEECKEICHMVVNCPTVYQDANFVDHPNNGFRLNLGFNSGWNKPSFSFDNHQHGGNGQYFNRNESQLWDIIRDQLRINDEFGKKIHATDKLVENISAKMLETQIQQIVVALPRQSNENPSHRPVQENMKSIFIVSKGKAPKSTGGSLGGVGPGNAMTPDKELSVAENFSAKSTRCIKDATSAVTSSPVIPAT
jgi:hypothetical protein